MNTKIVVQKLLEDVTIKLDAEISSKKRLFEEIGLIVEQSHAISRSEVFDALFARERIGSTGIGHGVAMPHGKLPKLKRFSGVFMRLANPIQFESNDNRPINLVFTLITPQAKHQTQHLELLSHFAEVFSKIENREALLSCSDEYTVLNILGKSNVANHD
jgi:PTS system nitrogen regulatory IIA component